MALRIRPVRRRHPPFALGTIRLVRGKVWMDPFRYISVKFLQLRRGRELDCSSSLAVSGRVGFFRLCPSFRRSRPSFSFFFCDQLSDSCAPIVEFRVEHSYFSKIPSLEG